MPTLAAPSWPILSALLGVALAAGLPRPSLSALAVLWTTAALGLHLPALGPVAVALAVAVALGAVAIVQPRPTARSLHLLSMPWLLAAGVADRPGPDVAIPGHVAAALACVVLIAALAAAVQWACTPGRRLALALVTLALPLAPAGGSLVRWQANLPLPHEGPASSWLAHGPFPVAVDLAPRWLACWPTLAWIAALLALALAWARKVRPSRGPQIPLAPMLLGLSGLLAVGSAIAGLSLPLHVPGGLLPIARPEQAGLDLGLLLTWLARLLTALALLRTSAPLHPVARGLPLAHGLALAGAVVLASVWLATAPGWFGGAWLADPAAYALAAIVVATAGALPALWLGADLPRNLAQLLQLLAALWLVGGAEAGWRLAGVLLAS